MKRFFGERPGGVCTPSTDLLQAFHRPSDPINVEAPDRSVTSLSRRQFAEMLLDCTRTYRDFMRIDRPFENGRGNLDTLWRARNGICAGLASQRWRQTPAVHFMLNEAIDQAEEMRTATWLANEGVEAFNSKLKEDIKHSTRGMPNKYTGKTGYVYVLERHEQKRAIAEETVVPTQPTGSSSDESEETSEQDNLRPPKHVSAAFNTERKSWIEY